MSRWQKSSEELKDHFAAALEEFEGIERRKMFGYPCCFLNGNMFTGLHEENWLVRLSQEDRERIELPSFEPFPGRKMREYVTLPTSILDDTEELDTWLNRSYAYASSLPPKKPKKK